MEQHELQLRTQLTPWEQAWARMTTQLMERMGYSFRRVRGAPSPEGSFRRVRGATSPEGSFRRVRGATSPEGSFRRVRYVRLS